MKFAVFRIGKEDFGIDIGKVVEFLEYPKSIYFARTPGFSLGSDNCPRRSITIARSEETIGYSVLTNGRTDHHSAVRR